MIHYPADETTPMLKLRLFYEPVEIYDPNGKFIGLFVPANMELGKRLQADTTGFCDDVELERIKATEKTGRTTKEVLARLEALAPSSPTSAAAATVNGAVEQPTCATR